MLPIGRSPSNTGSNFNVFCSMVYLSKCWVIKSMCSENRMRLRKGLDEQRWNLDLVGGQKLLHQLDQLKQQVFALPLELVLQGVKASLGSLKHQPLEAEFFRHLSRSMEVTWLQSDAPPSAGAMSARIAIAVGQS